MAHRIAQLRGVLTGDEWMLQSVDRRGTPAGNVLRSLAEKYAELECLEEELCMSATRPGGRADLDAAVAARQRMDDLCARLRQLPAYVRQCP